MPRFLALYTMRTENIARFRALPKSEQDAIDAKGVAKWKEWEAEHAERLVDRGAMVGKTRRATAAGLTDAVNTICGYVVVEAPDLATAASLFIDHPHVTVFPGDGVDVMPFVT